MKRILQTLVLSCLFGGMTATGFSAGKAKVEVTAKVLDNKKIAFSFKTIPTDGMKNNGDGPWKLDIKSSSGLKFEKTDLKRTDWDEHSYSFTAISNPSKEKSATINYKLIAFICTTDKTQCFREVIEDSAKVSWP